MMRKIVGIFEVMHNLCRVSYIFSCMLQFFFCLQHRSVQSNNTVRIFLLKYPYKCRELLHIPTFIIIITIKICSIENIHGEIHRYIIMIIWT